MFNGPACGWGKPGGGPGRGRGTSQKPVCGGAFGCAGIACTCQRLQKRLLILVAAPVAASHQRALLDTWHRSERKKRGKYHLINGVSPLAPHRCSATFPSTRTDTPSASRVTRACTYRQLAISPGQQERTWPAPGEDQALDHHRKYEIICTAAQDRDAGPRRRAATQGRDAGPRGRAARHDHESWPRPLT